MKALSVSWGFFIGVAPIWGYQLLLGMPLAHYFRLNKTITFIAANISIPPMIPFIIYGSLKVGEALTGNRLTILSRPMDSFTLSDISSSLWIYVLGSIVLALIMAVVGGLLSYVVFMLFVKQDKKKQG